MTAMLRLAATLLLLISLPAELCAADAQTDDRGRPIVGVVTQNQYFGADLTPLLASLPDQFDAAFIDVLEQMVATDFRARARQQAKAIARRRPDLVGLQEVLALGCIDALPTPPLEGGCNHPLIKAASVDFLKVTLKELRRLGARYEAAAVVENFDTRFVTLGDGSEVEIPGLPLTIDDVPVYITALDRDVILAHERTVQRVEPVEFPEEVCPRRSRDGCNYLTVLRVPLPVTVAGETVMIAFERGFVGVDAKVRGHRYRMVNTHLEVRQPVPTEPATRLLQVAQAAELIAVLGATTPASRRLILTGDINSSPEDDLIDGIVPPYERLVRAGLIDVWTPRPRVDPGFTCCQEADLMNAFSLLHERIDVIFADESLMRASARIIGDRRRDKTPSGLWPSDHAGLAARLLFRPGDLLTAAR